MESIFIKNENIERLNVNGHQLNEIEFKGKTPVATIIAGKIKNERW